MVVAAGITPLLPGLSIYRGLALLATSASAALLAMVTAAAIAIALSSGAILGEYLAQPIRREAGRMEASSPARAWSVRTPSARSEAYAAGRPGSAGRRTPDDKRG